MFCFKCGQEISIDSLYCPKCGAAQPPSSPSTEKAVLPKTQQLTFPDIGTPVSIFRKVRFLSPMCKEPVDVDFAWIEKHVDVIFTERYVVIVSAAPPTELKQFADKMNTRLSMGLGLLGGLGGALIGGVLSGGLSAAGAISERLYAADHSFAIAALREFYEAGLAIYGEKNALQFKLFNLKKPIFYTYNQVYVQGHFIWQDEIFDLCLESNDERQPERCVKMQFLKGKCSLEEDQKKLTEYDTYKLMSLEYSHYVFAK
jgi:hypothetical protein